MIIIILFTSGLESAFPPWPQMRGSPCSPPWMPMVMEQSPSTSGSASPWPTSLPRSTNSSRVSTGYSWTISYPVHNPPILSKEVVHRMLVLTEGKMKISRNFKPTVSMFLCPFCSVKIDVILVNISSIISFLFISPLL